MQDVFFFFFLCLYHKQRPMKHENPTDARTVVRIFSQRNNPRYYDIFRNVILEGTSSRDSEVDVARLSIKFRIAHTLEKGWIGWGSNGRAACSGVPPCSDGLRLLIITGVRSSAQANIGGIMIQIEEIEQIARLMELRDRRKRTHQTLFDFALRSRIHKTPLEAFTTVTKRWVRSKSPQAARVHRFLP